MNKYTPNNTNVSNDMHDMACGTGDTIMTPKELVLLVLFVVLSVTGVGAATIALKNAQTDIAKHQKCINNEQSEGATRAQAGTICGETNE